MPSLSWLKEQRKPNWLAILFFGVIGAAALGVATIAVKASTPPEDNTALVYADDLQAALGRGNPVLYPGAAHLPMLSAPVPGGRLTVTTCPGFLDAARRGEVPTAWATVPGAQNYGNCFPLTVLSVASRPRQYLAPRDGLGRVLAHRLALSSLAKATLGFVPVAALAAVGPRTASTLPGTKIGPRTVEMTLGGDRWRLEAVASADVRATGMEDLVVKVSRQDPTGTVSGYAVVADDGTGTLRGMAANRVLAMEGQEFLATEQIDRFN